MVGLIRWIVAVSAVGGVNGGIAHGTILHMLGLDHERRSYRHAGRDDRPTDVSGRVVGEILA